MGGGGGGGFFFFLSFFLLGGRRLPPARFYPPAFTFSFPPLSPILCPPFHLPHPTALDALCPEAADLVQAVARWVELAWFESVRHIAGVDAPSVAGGGRRARPKRAAAAPRLNQPAWVSLSPIGVASDTELRGLSHHPYIDESDAVAGRPAGLLALGLANWQAWRLQPVGRRRLLRRCDLQLDTNVGCATGAAGWTD